MLVSIALTLPDSDEVSWPLTKALRKIANTVSDRSLRVGDSLHIYHDDALTKSFATVKLEKEP